MTIQLTDGGIGDLDGIANGTIVDPTGGPAVVVPTASVPRASATTPAPVRLIPADMTAKYITVSPQQASANQPVTISTNVVNKGGQTGSYNLVLKINGEVEQTKAISVSPGVARPVTFTVTKAEPGTYVVEIGSQQSSFTITGADSSTTGSMPAGALIIFMLAGIVLLVGIMVILLRRESQTEKTAEK